MGPNERPAAASARSWKDSKSIKYMVWLFSANHPTKNKENKIASHGPDPDPDSQPMYITNLEKKIDLLVLTRQK